MRLLCFRPWCSDCQQQDKEGLQQQAMLRLQLEQGGEHLEEEEEEGEHLLLLLSLTPPSAMLLCSPALLLRLPQLLQD